MTSNESTQVVAEDAPIGVQLWPTRLPEFSKNFTLLSVEVVTRHLRDKSGTYSRTVVIWTYENLTTREFDLGEKVDVQFC